MTDDKQTDSPFAPGFGMTDLEERLSGRHGAKHKALTLDHLDRMAAQIGEQMKCGSSGAVYEKASTVNRAIVAACGLVARFPVNQDRRR